MDKLNDDFNLLNEFIYQYENNFIDIESFVFIFGPESQEYKKLIEND